MRIFVALRYYLDGRNSFHESRQWLRRGLSFGEHLSKATFARGLMDAAWFAYRQNDPQDCVQCAQKGLDLAKEINDPTLSAYAFRTMGVAQLIAGNFDLARESSEKSFLLYKEAGSIRDMIAAVGNLAQSQFYQGNLSSANDLLESNLILLDEIDDLYIVAYILFLLGGVKVLLGEFEQAHIHLRKAVLLYHKINNIFAAGLCFVGFAGAANGYKNPLRAARILGAREAIHESMGANFDPGVQRFHAAFVAQTRAMLDEVSFESAWVEGRAMSLDQAIEYAIQGPSEALDDTRE
jgi:tetratricopeptide (TPR) repeat protein